MMKFVVAALLAITLVEAVTPQESAFIAHVTKYNKKYDGVEEFFKRFNIFKSNVAYIESENAKNHSYSLGLNEFADMTRAEFFSQMTGLLPERPAGREVHTAPADFAPLDSVDWRSKGAVTPVKNQGQCGSCWAFSTTGSMEGAFFLKNKKLPSLSEQQLVDCAGSSGNQGCNGGLMDYAFQWISSNGICAEADYPYVGTDQTCKTTCKSVGKNKGFKDVAQGSESSLASAVALAPVSVAIEADQSAFQFYSGGVFSAACGTQLDHGVLAVGYSSSGSQNYWIVKNSWGTSWGEQGYIRMIRGKNECGINNMASYPTM
jgi:C1A family cysteine protease